MTLLAALWRHDGGPAADPCEAMLRAQGGDGWRRRAAVHGAIAFGAAVPETMEEAGPIEDASGAFTLLADARLDNRADFLPALGLTAASAALLPDARLMMLCIARWGAGAIDRFVGDFALALWDRRADRLLLARDHAGMRPLHFHEGPRGVAVASMGKGLHALDFVPRGVDEARLLETLASLPHGGRGTYFKDIARVEPGEVLTFRRGGRASRIFWAAPADQLSLASPGDYAEGLVEQLDAAVEARLRGAGARVATHLSAGLDSSAVTTSAASRFGGRVLAFTAVPPPGALPALPAGRFGDEGALAAATAGLYPNIDHRLVSTGTRLPLEDLGWELDLFERPDLNLANMVWGNRINDAAQAAGAGILLVGTMGNISISYDGTERLDQLLGQGRLATWLGEAAAARRGGMPARALLGRAARQILPGAALRPLRRFRKRDHHPAAAGVIAPGAPGLADLLARWEAAQDPSPGDPVAARAAMIRRVDPGSYNKAVLLRWNIELRDPTSDRRLFEYCLRVPLAQYFRDGTPRALIRAALAGRVPEAVRLGRRRGLQSPHWFAMLSEARDEAQRLLAAIEACAPAAQILDLARMRRLLETWPDPRESHGPPIYRSGFLRGLSVGTFIRLHACP